ncbi:hypothetical protein PL10110_180030 [Planktothrix agardhii]|nr:hypothetical protein PL10110_180030 [Planktothrix agardhii]
MATVGVVGFHEEASTNTEQLMAKMTQIAENLFQATAVS